MSHNSNTVKLLLLLTPWVLPGQIVTESLIPRYVLTSDYEQSELTGAGFSHGNQPSQTHATGFFGVHGADEGASALLPDGRIMMWFGDAPATYFDNTANKLMSIHWRTECNFGTGAASLCLGIHPVGLFTPNPSFGRCHQYENLQAMLRGAAKQASTCPPFTIVTDPTHTGNTPKVAYHYINSAVPGETYGAGMPPTGIFTVGTKIYGFVHAKGLDIDKGSLKLRQILVKSDRDSSPITATTPITWTRVGIFSDAPDVPVLTVRAINGSNVVTRTEGPLTSSAWSNTALWEGYVIAGAWHSGTTRFTVRNVSGDTITLSHPVSCSTCTDLQFVVLPNQNNSTGKFIQASCEPLLAANIPANLTDALPLPLRNQDVAFCFGASYSYRNSNLYLAVMRLNSTEIEARTTYNNGLSGVYYLTGLASQTPTWTLQDEDSAIPLLSSWAHQGTSSGLPAIGENSVRWYPQIERWILTSASAEQGGAWARASTSVLPWLWEQETQIMTNHNQSTSPSSWHAQIVHSPADTAYFNFTLFPPVYDPVTAGNPQFTGTSPYGLPGNIYGLYQMPSSTAELSGGVLKVFTAYSLFNPYVVGVGSFDYKIPKRPSRK